MELVSLAVAFLIQGPDKVAPAAGVFNSRPTQVYVSNRQKNVEQLARGILQCYHPKAKYEVADMIEQPWRRQKQFGATRSAVFHIRYSTPAGASNQMFVALLGRKNEVRAEIIGNTAIDPFGRDCELEEWKAATAPVTQAKAAG